jgi:26S proteasome regulatory subunit N3
VISLYKKKLFFSGRIKAIQLDYTASHMHLNQAIRKAPQNTVTAGFQQAVMYRFCF